MLSPLRTRYVVMSAAASWLTTSSEFVGAPKLDEHSIRDRFLEFIEAMDMALSYKPVMLLALLDAIDEQGRARASDVARRFQQFYRDRRPETYGDMTALLP